MNGAFCAVAGIRTGVALACLGLGLLAAGCGGGGALGPQSLVKRSDAVGSLAAEGALLAQDGAAGKTTAIFTREHGGFLSKAASGTAAALKTAKTKPGLEPELRKLRRLSAEVRDQLERLRRASQSEQRTLAGSLGKAAAAAATISKSIA
ncbi:MAG: hypothetical protein QOK36_1581 [Gaiellales bacterium]|jgi:hypothetical protein|nr:hypothetical protein [Gaiellales bacterium]